MAQPATSASNTSLLSAPSISRIILASLLPSTTTPQIQSAADAVAIACHAGMICVGFRLIGLGEDDRIEAESDSSAARPLPAQWNTLHAFRYKHEQSSMEYLLKVSRLGNKIVVYGIGIGDDKTASFDILTADYISASALPATITTTGETTSEENEAALRTVTNIFISPNRLVDLMSLLKVNIIQKLIPGLQKEGYEENREASSTRYRRPEEPPAHVPLRDDPLIPEPARPNPLIDPSVMPRRPRVPVGDFPPPGFEDEFELQRPPRGGGDGSYYPNIGERDLYPPGLGPNDPLRTGGLGVGPYGGGGLGGGMHPTFDDPLFAGGRRGGGGPSNTGYDPQVPPGARFDDPLGPAGDGDDGIGGYSRRGGGAFGPGRRGGGGGGGAFGGMGGAPHNPFSGFGPGDFI